MKKTKSILIDINLPKITFKHIKKVTEEKANALAELMLDIICNEHLTEKTQFKKVTRLIKQGANINFKFYSNYTLLIEAMANKRYEIAKLLIQIGADVKAVSNYGTSAIYWACTHNNYELVRILTENGALKNYCSTKPLLIAMLNGKNSPNLIINYLLENGINIDETDNNHFTALFYAVVQNNKEVVIDLLEHGANPLIKSYVKGKTAYDFAIKNNFEVANIIETYEHKWEEKIQKEQENEEKRNKMFDEIIDEIKIKVALKKEQETMINPIGIDTEKEPNK